MTPDEHAEHIRRVLVRLDIGDCLMTIPFISRHIPTAAQQATVRERFGALVCPDPITFTPGRVVEQVAAVMPPDASERVVAGVFPGWALLELLRDGWTVVEFVNEPSSRARGAFVCLGAFVHRAPLRNWENTVVYNDMQPSDFIACPIPVRDQEDGPLLVGLRSALTDPAP